MFGDGDTNVGIRLKDGTLVEVIYPERIATDWDTPWLDHPGSRNWGNPQYNFPAKRDSFSERYVIAKSFCCSSYGQDEGIQQVIPLARVACFEPLSEDKVRLGRDNREREMELERASALADPSRYIRLEEFQKLMDRVTALEQRG